MPPRPRGPDELTLRRKSPLPVWIQIAWRVALVFGLLAFAVIIHWLERDGLRDNLDGKVSFLDVIYFTMISITTTGYGDVVPVADNTRMFDALVVTPIRIFFVLIFVGTAYTFVLRRTWDKWHMARVQRTLSGHIVVAGYGITASEAVDELIALGAKASEIVVIDCSSEALERAEALGCAILQADATRDKTLQAVHVERARALIVSAGSDDTSILITLTARHLAPGLNISVAVRNEDNELLARQAGASTVINPVSFAGCCSPARPMAPTSPTISPTSPPRADGSGSPSGWSARTSAASRSPRSSAASASASTATAGPTASGSPKCRRSSPATASSRSCRPLRRKLSFRDNRRGQSLSRAFAQMKSASLRKVTVPIRAPEGTVTFQTQRMATKARRVKVTVPQVIAANLSTRSVRPETISRSPCSTRVSGRA
jgi:voltage-gated potassium channel